MLLDHPNRVNSMRGDEVFYDAGECGIIDYVPSYDPIIIKKFDHKTVNLPPNICLFIESHLFCFTYTEKSN